MISLSFRVAAALLIVTNCAGAVWAGDAAPLKLSLPEMHPAVEPEQKGNVKAVTLTGLRDSGFTLQQLKQEAIHLYQEATRTPVTATTGAEVSYPKRISKKDLSATLTYLPARAQWLTYYIGTMEPIIELLQEDAQEVRSGVRKRLVPKDAKIAFEPLVGEWNTHITNLNAHLDKLNGQLSQSSLDNLLIAKEAVSMYDLIENLESVRKRAFAILRAAQKRPASEEVEL